MRAMRINRKKKECANAPIGPFTMFSHCVYGYNVRSELISSRREAEVLEYQYQYSTTPNSTTPSLISMSYDALGLVPKQNMDRYDFVVRTSKEIDAKIINVIEEFNKSKPNYGEAHNNCAQAIRRILIKGGLGDIPFCIFPNGLLESLRNRGRFNIYEANIGNLFFCPLR
jgi:hypothetical protein